MNNNNNSNKNNNNNNNNNNNFGEMFQIKLLHRAIWLVQSK